LDNSKELHKIHIGKVVKTEKEIVLTFYDEDFNILEYESFPDVYTLNFFLQTLPRKYNKIKKTLLIIHDKKSNSVDIVIAKSENSYFIQ
jgi:hypothetical protein